MMDEILTTSTTLETLSKNIQNPFEVGGWKNANYS